MSETVKVLSYDGDGENYGECTIFLDGSDNLLGIVEGNDGQWRGEYFNPIFSKIKIDIIDINENDIPNIDIPNLLKSYYGF
jgi:hypothetical protein